MCLKLDNKLYYKVLICTEKKYDYHFFNGLGFKFLKLYTFDIIDVNKLTLDFIKNFYKFKENLFGSIGTPVDISKYYHNNLDKYI